MTTNVTSQSQEKLLSEVNQLKKEDISFQKIEENYLTRAAATVQIS